MVHAHWSAVRCQRSIDRQDQDATAIWRGQRGVQWKRCRSMHSRRCPRCKSIVIAPTSCADRLLSQHNATSNGNVCTRPYYSGPALARSPVTLVCYYYSYADEQQPETMRRTRTSQDPWRQRVRYVACSTQPSQSPRSSRSPSSQQQPAAHTCQHPTPAYVMLDDLALSWHPTTSPILKARSNIEARKHGFVRT